MTLYFVISAVWAGTLSENCNVNETFCGIPRHLKPTMALQQTFLSGREHSLQNIVARFGFSCKFL